MNTGHVFDYDDDKVSVLLRMYTIWIGIHPHTDADNNG